MLSWSIFLFLVPFFNTHLVYGLGVFLPLYLYPDSDCVSWAPVNTAISAYPKIQWYIVINPDSGPGQPDELYQSCVAALRIPAATKQVIMGFVKSTSANVEADIDTYAGWNASARPAGIFFDSINPTSSELSTYEGYVSYAKSKGFTFIALNPGETAPGSYLTLGDLVNTYESAYASFDPTSLSGNLTKQSVNLVTAPTNASYTSLLVDLERSGVAAVYITDQSDSTNKLPTALSAFVSAVANVESASSSSASTNPSGTPASFSSSANFLPSSSSTSLPSLSASTQLSSSTFGTLVTRRSPSNAAIVGGSLAALVVVLTLIIMLLCIRRKRRQAAALQAENVAPFTQVVVDTINNINSPNSSVSSPTSENTGASAARYTRESKAPILTRAASTVTTSTNQTEREERRRPRGQDRKPPPPLVPLRNSSSAMNAGERNSTTTSAPTYYGESETGNGPPPAYQR